MAEASFSRKPVVSGLKITGTLTRKGGGTVTQTQADAVLAKVVDALDSGDFDTETLRVKVG